MTTRLAMAFVLLFILLVQAWGLVSIWRDDPLRSLAVTKKKEVLASAAMVGKTLSLQPMVSGVLPDLNEGYIFNVERSLAAGDGKDGQSQSAGNEGMAKVQYNGAIIAGDNTRALLSFPLTSPGATAKLGFLRVVVGDTVNGFAVTDIQPDKIIFSRGGQKITKLLRDRTKEQTDGQNISSATAQKAQAPMGGRAIQTLPQNNIPRVLVPPKRPGTQQSDAELRNKPLRKRPEPPGEAQAPEAEVSVPNGSQEAAPVSTGTELK
jgi:hypothetical protein